MLAAALHCSAACASAHGFVLNMTAPLQAVPAGVVGVELEGVGHSIYGGGLYSQLVFDESFEDPRDDPAAAPGSLPPHWRYLGSAEYTAERPLNGNMSLRLRCGRQAAAGWCAAAANRNVYQRGIAVQAGRDYEGYVFLRSLSGASVGLGLYSMDGWSGVVPLAETEVSVVSDQWRQFNFSLTAERSDPAAAFAVSLRDVGDVGVDMVFVEPGAWGRWQGLHLRRDVTERLLLSGALKSIRFDGTSVVANPNYLWRHARGPAWLRPPRYGDVWYPYISNGFGLFDVLEVAERAGLVSATVGINVRAETPASAAALIEYCYGNTSTPMGELRAADGQREPYTSAAVFELGNEEGSPDYAAKATAILAAMEQRLRDVAPAGVGRVRYALAFNDWQKAGALADAARNRSTGGRDITWDQHDGGTSLGDAAAAFAGHDRMLRFLRSHGWTGDTPLFIGETNCAVSPGACESMQRALLYGLYTNLAARRGYAGTVSPAVWAYSTCSHNGSVCGASDGRADWPQAALIITPDGTVPQPPWYAHRMVGRTWGSMLVPVVGNATSACAGGVVDVAALANSSSASAVALHVVSTCSEEVQVRVRLLAPASFGAAEPFEVLSAPDLSARNSVAAPSAVVPASLACRLDGGAAVLTLPPHAIAAGLLSVEK